VGDVVTIVLPGAYGKPRPALVVQSDLFDALASVTVLQSPASCAPPHCLEISIEPNTDNGLRKKSQVMVDKAQTVPVTRLAPRSADCTRTLSSRSIGRWPFFLESRKY